ncbi:MAG TPA: AI-2E family transporter [Acidimicrobiales bacterium]|nr:AI-2E family transporter [Acidimicrobiales bacterium]
MPRALEVLTAWSWRLVVVGLALLGIVLLAVRLRLVLLPVGIALLLTTALMPVRRAMTDRGVPLPLAMLGVVATFFATIGLAGVLVVPPLIDEFRDLGDTLEDAGDDVEDWFADGPLGLDEEWVADTRARLEDSVENARVSDGALVDGATLAGEVLAGLLLALVVTFFVVKDGPDIQRAVLSVTPERHRRTVRAAGAGAWGALGGYLRGSAMLGAFEAVVIGGALLLVGAGLVLPVAVLTFVAAFFPFVGAITAGAVAVAVSLVTAGPAAAGVVVVVAIAVQQLDNDLLAPVIYGKALSLHPLVVILALTSGGALAGLAGAFIAVPLVAVAMRAHAAVREVRAGDVAPDAG